MTTILGRGAPLLRNRPPIPRISSKWVSRWRCHWVDMTTRWARLVPSTFEGTAHGIAASEGGTDNGNLPFGVPHSRKLFAQLVTSLRCASCMRVHPINGAAFLKLLASYEAVFKLPDRSIATTRPNYSRMEEQGWLVRAAPDQAHTGASRDFNPPFNSVGSVR